MAQLYKLIFWAGCLSLLMISFIPIAGNFSKVDVGPVRLDYLLHFTAYMVICLYYIIGRKIGYKLFEKRPLLKLTLLLCSLAAFTEFVQLWVPDRTFNIVDWLSNMGGIVIGFIAVKLSGK